ncbi:hypothetical protein GTW67_12150 [Streptomyces sp. SID5910]|nr:hypothetical protein [Streptomyces sp. SID5910]
MVADGDGVEPARVPAVLLPVREALPVLTRARADASGHRAAVFWGAVAVEALHLVARGLLLPGLSETDHDAWRAGPLDARDTERIRHLAAAMPPEAHAVPVDGAGPPRLPDPERLVRAFLDAVADTLPRTPAATLVTDGPAYAAAEPRQLPELHSWAADVAAGHDTGVRLSLRVEVRDLPADSGDASPAFRAVPQVHSVSDPALVADTAEVWSGAVGDAFGTRARMDTLLALRRAARTWPPLAPLLSAAVPEAVDLADEEITELLGAGTRALAGAGVDVHWPRELARDLTTRAEVGPPDGEPVPGAASEKGGTSFGEGGPSFLSADALLAFDWWFALGGEQLTRDELDRLAEANRPVVRLRDRWVLVDPEEVRRARARQDSRYCSAR